VNATVDVERVLHIGNTGHNPFGENARKAQGVVQVLQEIPVDRVESFPQIHFEHASRGGVFPEVTPGQVLTDEDIEKNFLSWDESTLTLVDQRRQNTLEARPQQLSDDFVDDIAAGNGLEIRGVVRVSDFREYNQLSGAYEKGHGSRLEELANNSTD